MRLRLQMFGGRGGGSRGGGGGGNNSQTTREVTPTYIPDTSVENIQKFVDQFGTGMSVEQMVDKVYRALPDTGRVFRGIGGAIADKGASIVNSRYLEINGGPTLQFIRQKSRGTWKVKEIR